MSNGYYLFWFVELCIGAIVGASAAKGATSLRAGLAITLLLGTVAKLAINGQLRLADDAQRNDCVQSQCGASLPN